MSSLDYFSSISKLIDEIKEKQIENINKAAEKFAEAVKNDKIIYVFGTGHSHIIGIEMFVRAGGLANIQAMLDESVLTSSGARRGGAIERLGGLAEIIWDDYRITKGDIILVISNSGRNALPIEMAMLAKKNEIFTIGLTSLKHSKSVVSRHDSGKRLFEVTDLIIDTCTPIGDVLLNYGGVQSGPSSTVAGAVIVNSIVCETLKILSRDKYKLPVFVSQNIDGYNNDELYKKYESRIKFI